MARDKSILLRVSQEEKSIIEERAREAGVGVSDYLRELGLQGAKPAAQIISPPEPTEPPFVCIFGVDKKAAGHIYEDGFEDSVRREPI